MLGYYFLCSTCPHVISEVIAGAFGCSARRLLFRLTAHTEPGDHHFVHTFPGHWMMMNGSCVRLSLAETKDGLVGHPCSIGKVRKGHG